MLNQHTDEPSPRATPSADAHFMYFVDLAHAQEFKAAATSAGAPHKAGLVDEWLAQDTPLPYMLMLECPSGRTETYVCGKGRLGDVLLAFSKHLNGQVSWWIMLASTESKLLLDDWVTQHAIPKSRVFVRDEDLYRDGQTLH